MKITPLKFWPFFSAEAVLWPTGTLYVKNSFWSKLDAFQVQCLIVHENAHVRQIKRYGKFRWYWKYIFDQEFRFLQELDAYATEFIYEQLNYQAESTDLNYSAETSLRRKARQLSVNLYQHNYSENECFYRLIKEVRRLDGKILPAGYEI